MYPLNKVFLENQAHQLINEADKKIASGILRLIFGDKINREEVIQRYQHAGYLFKTAENWEQASLTFNKSAIFCMEKNSLAEAANDFVLAAKCYEKYDIYKAIQCLNKATNIYIKMGRVVMAAKHHQTIGEFYEKNLYDIETAINHYEQATKLFKMKDNTYQANKCLLKIANYAAGCGLYKNAYEMFKEICLDNLKVTLLIISSRENFFRATLCAFCLDVIDARRAMDFFRGHCSSLENSKEYKFLDKIINNFELGNIEEFNNAIKEFKVFFSLDNCCEKMLSVIKKKIQKYPDVS